MEPLEYRIQEREPVRQLQARLRSTIQSRDLQEARTRELQRSRFFSPFDRPEEEKQERVDDPFEFGEQREEHKQEAKEIEFLEEKEEKEKTQDTIVTAINHLALNTSINPKIDTSNTISFGDQSVDFSPSGLISYIAANSGTSQSNPRIFDVRGSKKPFIKLIETQLRKSLASRNLLDLKSTFKTIGIAAKQLQSTSGIDVVSELKEIVENIVPLQKFRQLESAVFSPVDIPDLINTLTKTDLKRLEERDLSLDEIRMIRRQFAQDLQDLEQEIVANTEHEIATRRAAAEFGLSRGPADLFEFTRNTFLQLKDYISKHVANRQLNRLLLNDIDNKIVEERDKFGIQIGAAPPKIIPLSATRLHLLSDTSSQDVSSILGDSLDAVIATQNRIGTDKRFKRQGPKLSNDVITLAKNFNEFAQKNQIKDPLTQAPILVPLEFSGEQKSGAVVLPFTRPLSTKEILDELSRVRDSFERKEQSFQIVPRLIRDHRTGDVKSMILRDLQDMRNKEKSRLIMNAPPPKHRKDTISKRSSFPGIEIKRGPRRPRLQKRGEITTISHGARIRELKIKSSVTIEELAKIANMIVMESGSLEDVNGVSLLTVIKGVTTIKDVLIELMKLMESHAGNDFSIIFAPHEVFGGMFIDGSLDIIHKHKKLMESLRRPSIKMHRPASSVQHGGDLSSTVIKGSRQPDPAFGPHRKHIPFPSIGRIDNTGFIDQSHIRKDVGGFLPMIDWVDMPVIHLTHFV